MIAEKSAIQFCHFYRKKSVMDFDLTPLFASMAIPRSMFSVQFRHATTRCAFFQRVFTADVHHHLDVVSIVNVQLFSHGPEELIFTGGNDAIFENHFNHVAVILNG